MLPFLFPVSKRNSEMNNFKRVWEHFYFLLHCFGELTLVGVACQTSVLYTDIQEHLMVSTFCFEFMVSHKLMTALLFFPFIFLF